MAEQRRAAYSVPAAGTERQTPDVGRGNKNQMKISLQVGNQEHHKFFFSWNQFWGTTRIIVDDNIVHKSGITLTSPVRVIAQDDTATGWKVRLPCAVTRTDMKQFLPFPFFGDYVDIQLVERWEVHVGTQEKHVVVVEKERERLCAGFRPQKYRVFVDGALVKQCRGF